MRRDQRADISRQIKSQEPAVRAHDVFGGDASSTGGEGAKHHFQLPAPLFLRGATKSMRGRDGFETTRAAAPWKFKWMKEGASKQQP